jgi:alanine transaminase
MITVESLNSNLLSAEYAVRGPIVKRAQELEEQGRRIIYCNIGNPQALKQPPLTYIRQMLSLLEFPALMRHPGIKSAYPADILERAARFLEKNPAGTGAYTQSAGIPFIRQAVAEFIHRRDGIPSRKENIILTDGASKGVQAAILALLKAPLDGFMIPVPQYPLYSATIDLYGGKQIPYYLDEAHHWQLSERILTGSIDEAKRRGIHPVAIAVINPGNPTGAVLTHHNIEMVIKFARRHSLAIFADEVYQENVYREGERFHSFAKVMTDIGETDVSLFSFHSVSKGFLGECGHRGGYVEFRNIPETVLAELVKLQSISLCANVPGQVATYLMVSPPQEGEESYPVYAAEREAILCGLKKKAELLGREINKIPGMSLEVPHGAMYAFVKIDFPHEPAIESTLVSAEERLAEESKRDFDYCLSLLEDTGICVVPGSGFGQLPGTFHFRTTFLPPLEDIEKFVRDLRQFHLGYLNRSGATLQTTHIGEKI